MADNRRRSPNGWKTSTIAGQGVNGYVATLRNVKVGTDRRLYHAGQLDAIL